MIPIEWVLLATQVVGFGLLFYLYTTVKSATGTTPEPTARDHQLEQTIEELMKELRATAEDIARDLEDRSNWLQVLMAEADRKLEALEQQNLVLPPSSERVLTPTALSPELRRQVVELASQGYSAIEIAQRTKTGREEVELLLQLRERYQ